MLTKFDAVVVSAPSGTGKTTLNRRLIRAHPEALEMSISHTTRQMRPGDKDGVDYHFIGADEFVNLRDHERFLEWAEVHGHYYGTAISEIERIKQGGRTPLLEIDVQGWLKARGLLANPLSIFILPPSLKVLWARLEGRGSDELATRFLRFQNAYHEIQSAENYDFFVVNNDLDDAFNELEAIVINGKRGRLDAKEGRAVCDKLKKEYQNADWIQELLGNERQSR